MECNMSNVSGEETGLEDASERLYRNKVILAPMVRAVRATVPRKGGSRLQYQQYSAVQRGVS